VTPRQKLAAIAALTAVVGAGIVALNQKPAFVPPTEAELNKMAAAWKPPVAPVLTPEQQAVQERAFQDCVKTRALYGVLGKIPLEPDWYRDKWCRTATKDVGWGPFYHD
jgi:hypothetical protein